MIDYKGWFLTAVFLLACIDAQAACGPIPSDYVAYGAGDLSTDRNVRVNSNRLSGSGNALQPDGVRTTPSPAPVMPDLDPASFPSFSGGGDITVSGGDTGATGAGTYGEIKVEEDATFSFTDSGGSYYIDKLTIEKNVQITFSPGIYYIDTAKFDQDVELQVSPSGEVKLFINSEIEVGKKASINQSGGVDEFQVYGYSGAKALLKQGADFRGLLYFPSSSSEIKLEKNVDFNGVVVTAGDVIVGKNVDFTLSVDDQTAIGNVSTCPTPTTMPDPVGYWQMDETTWGTVADSSGNGFDGTAKNGAATDDTGPAIPGPIGTCRYGTFDGSNDYVSISALPNLTNSFTIAAWIRADELGNDQRIFADDRNNTGGFAFSLGDGGAGKLRFFSRHVSPVVLDSAAVISQGNWHFVAVVHDVGAKTRKIYVDGVTTPVVQDVYTGAWGTDNGDASIGGEVDGTSEGNSRWRFNGNIDEVRVYQNALSGSQVATLMGLTHPCSTGVPDDASGFNCMVSGGDDITGRLYTQLAGQPFVFDVSALKDSDGDGTSDSRETDFATKGDRTLLVELVDGTGGASCATYPALTPAVNQNLVFTAADAGRKSTSVLTVNSAYRELRCRVTDATPATPVVGCSTDSFSVRPLELQLQIPTLTNSSASGDPKQVAGTGFTLQALAIAGYDGTPTLESSRLEAHSGAVQAGNLGGLFSAADPATGVAEGLSFTYSEVGNFRLLTEGLVDRTFTATDQPGDCIDDFSNSADGSGRVGCNFGNTSNSAWVGRFIPDHFTLAIDNNGALANSCVAGGFSYSGQAIGYGAGQIPTATITAWNGLGTPTVTQNYTALYNHLLLSGMDMPDTTSDASQMGVDGATPVTLNWGLGSAALNDLGNGTIQFVLSGDTFTYGRGSNDQVAPFTSAIELEIRSITDDDGVLATGLPQQFQPTGVPIRFGRLALANAHGSELETLKVQFQVEYYDGPTNGFRANTTDICTSGVALTLSDLDGSDNLLVTTGAGKETAIYADVATAAGYSADDLSNPAWLLVQPPVSGQFNLNLQAPGAGNSGSAGVQVDAPAWLEYRWSGGVMSDPSSKATFGIFNRPSSIIYMRESY